MLSRANPFDSNRTVMTKVLLATFFVVVVILPLVTMMTYLFKANAGAVVASPQFKTALSNSLVATVTATIISVVLAYMLALCVVRTQIRHKTVITVLITLPMLIPSVSHGMGLILLFGSNGLVTTTLGLSSSIYGFKGVVLGSVMYSFPVAYLMISDILKYQDYTPYEACKVLNITGLNRFHAVTLPYLRKPMISVFFATFTMIVTDYGVPLMIGGKFMTLPVLMYQEVIGLLDFGKGAVIGAFFLIPAVIAFILDQVNKDKAAATFTKKPFPVQVSSPMLVLSYSVCVLTILFVLLPVLSFIVLSVIKKYPINMAFTLDHIRKTMNTGGLQYLGNSLFIALLTSVVGTVLAFGVGYFSSRSKGRMSRFLHMVAITALAIPGLVLGLSYMLFFKGTFLYATFAILILVNTMHFFASPYLMAYNSFSKINTNLEAVAQTLGITKLLLIKDVFIPQMAGTILEMFSYFFVNSMMTISAVSFLATASNKPLSLMINLFQAQMVVEGAAFVSLTILAVNLIVKFIVYILGKKLVSARA